MKSSMKGDKKKTKSRYAKKLARKIGRGTRDPRWQWWAEVEGKTRSVMQGVPSGQVSSRLQHDQSLRASLR